MGLALVVAALGADAVVRYADSFDAGFEAWQPIVPALWEIRHDGDNAYVALTKAGTLREGVRRPAEYLRLKGSAWRNVTLSAKLMSLRPTTLKGRDVVLLFGWQDDTHTYYVHVSNDSNNTTHNIIMKVDGETRTPLQKEKKPEPRLSDGWHTVRVRHTAEGDITVWMDDLEKPLMTAHDTRYASGAVGIGSFDDNAAFDDVTVEGELVPAE